MFSENTDEDLAGKMLQSYCNCNCNKTIVIVIVIVSGPYFPIYFLQNNYSGPNSSESCDFSSQM